MQVVLGWPALPWVLSEKAKAKSLGCVRLSATPWTAAYQASLSMGFSRQEYWSRLPFPSLGDLSNPGIEPVSPVLSGRFFTNEPSKKPLLVYTDVKRKWLSGMTSLVARTVQNLPAMQETWVWSLGKADPLEEGMATHSCILACRIPGTEEPGGLQYMGPQKVRKSQVTNTFTFYSPYGSNHWCSWQ